MIYKIIPADQIGRANPSSRKEETKQKISEYRSKDMHYTYIVECRDKTLYTGWTTDLEKRIRMHNEGKGAKYTKSRAPVRLVYYEQYETKQEALKRAYAIKQLSRKEKLALIKAYTHT